MRLAGAQNQVVDTLNTEHADHSIAGCRAGLYNRRGVLALASPVIGWCIIRRFLARPRMQLMSDQALVFNVEPQAFQQDVIERSQQVPILLLFWTDQVAPSAETKRQLEAMVNQL